MSSTSSSLSASSSSSSDAAAGKRKRDVQSEDTDGESTQRPRRVNRHPPQHFEPSSKEEAQALKAALEISKTYNKRVDPSAIPYAPVFRPTAEEFADPIRIWTQAEPAGIIKVIPPKEWKPPAPRMNATKTFPTKLQRLHLMQEGKAFGDGRNYTLNTFREMAKRFKRQWFDARGMDADKMSFEDIEREFWRIVDTCTLKVEVEYGNDLSSHTYGSGFPKRPPEEEPKPGDEGNIGEEGFYERTGWNLNNLPSVPGSLLRNVVEHIDGINVPWMYLGMLFASFCWHNEDNYLNSANYMHEGAAKTWYGIPGDEAEKFEKVVRQHVPDLFREKPDLLYHLNFLFPPSLLLSAGVNVVRLVQQPGEFVFTMPQAYHAGFSHGFTCAEAVNFAPSEWIPFGAKCMVRYIGDRRKSVFNYDQLMLQLAEESFGAAEGKDRAYFDINGLMALRGEVGKIFRDYKEQRDKHIAMGMREYVLQKVGDEEMRQCCHCMQFCSVAAVICGCSFDRVACLRDSAHLCSCPPTKKVVGVWKSVESMKMLLDKISARIEDMRQRQPVRQKQRKLLATTAKASASASAAPTSPESSIAAMTTAPSAASMVVDLSGDS